jgi:phi13 family phage major tail protein
MANKVKYGLKSVYYAPLTITETGGVYTYTYGTPKALLGAVNLSLEAQGELTTFRADNVDYWVASSNNGYEGDFELALLSDDFKQDCLGELKDSNDVLYEVANATPKTFALLFQFEGDAKARRHVMYECTATRPAMASQTTDTTITPVTDSITIKAVARKDNNVVKASTPYDDNTSTTYTGWFSAVYNVTP